MSTDKIFCIEHTQNIQQKLGWEENKQWNESESLELNIIFFKG